MYRLETNTRSDVLNIFNKNEESAKEDIENVKSWLKTQPNLPEVMEDTKILNFLQLNKFNIEKTKNKIINYYTIRRKIPDFYTECNPKLPKLQSVFENTYCFSHPKAIEGLHRVLFIKMKRPNTYTPRELMKTFLNIFEVRLDEDCMFDDICIMDMHNITFRDMLKLTPKLQYHLLMIYKDVYSFRLKGMYFLNSPFYISIWIQIFKFFMPKKLFDRIHVYRDAEIMKELFSLDELPRDYGGNGKSLDDLNEMMIRKLEERQEIFDNLDRLNQTMMLKKTTD